MDLEGPHVAGPARGWEYHGAGLWDSTRMRRGSGYTQTLVRLGAGMKGS